MLYCALLLPRGGGELGNQSSAGCLEGVVL